MQLPKIRVYFTDFWGGFDPRSSSFWSSLSMRYDLVLDPERPDILFFSCFGGRHLHFDCVKVYYTGENVVPDFNLCDYAIGFHHLTFEDRYLRYPCFDADHVFQYATAARRQAIAGDLTQRAFCNFIYSNARADPIRDSFFHILSQRRHVDSLGRHLKNKEDAVSDRNKGDWGASKLEILRNYNFTIAFENSETSGYTTEKIAHAFEAGTIPIYWGDPRVTDDFNPDAFIHLHDFATPEDCADYVLEISEDRERMAAYLSAPVFKGGAVPRHLKRETFDAFLYDICDQTADKRTRRARHGGYANDYIAKHKHEQHIRERIAKIQRISKRFSFRRAR